MRFTTATHRRSGLRCAGVAATLALVLSGTIASPTHAVADPGAGPSSQLFDMWNLTGAPVTVAGFYNHPDRGYRPQPLNTLPAPGTVIPVGQNMQVKIDSTYATFASVVGKWGSLDQGWRILMKYNAGDRKHNPTIDDVCQPAAEKPAIGSACGVTSGKNVVTVADGRGADGKGNLVAVPASDAQRQADLFNALCGSPYVDALQIKCNYSQMKNTESHLPYTLPPGFGRHYNGNPTTVAPDSVRWKKTVSSTTTFGVSAGASKKFFDVISLGIKVEYSKVNTETYTFDETLGMPVEPKSYGYFCAGAPLNHWVGTMTVSAGNTVWTMANVTVDTANPDGHPLYNTYSIDHEVSQVPDPCADLVSGKIKAHLTSTH